MYVLRRAHTNGRADEPVKALGAAGLVDVAGLQFEDPLLACRGLEPWLLYMEVLCCAVLCCAVLCCAVLCCAVLWPEDPPVACSGLSYGCSLGVFCAVRAVLSMRLFVQ